MNRGEVRERGRKKGRKGGRERRREGRGRRLREDREGEREESKQENLKRKTPALRDFCIPQIHRNLSKHHPIRYVCAPTTLWWYLFFLISSQAPQTLDVT